MIKAGKKTLQWNRIRKELKDDFEKRGITTCELRFPNCWHNNALSFAHVDKRFYLQTDSELRLAVLACVPCHNIVESWPRQKMREYLEKIIEQRTK